MSNDNRRDNTVNDDPTTVPTLDELAEIRARATAKGKANAAALLADYEEPGDVKTDSVDDEVRAAMFAEEVAPDYEGDDPAYNQDEGDLASFEVALERDGDDPDPVALAEREQDRAEIALDVQQEAADPTLQEAIAQESRNVLAEAELDMRQQYEKAIPAYQTLRMRVPSYEQFKAQREGTPLEDAAPVADDWFGTPVVEEVAKVELDRLARTQGYKNFGQAMEDRNAQYDKFRELLPGAIVQPGDADYESAMAIARDVAETTGQPLVPPTRAEALSVKEWIERGPTTRVRLEMPESAATRLLSASKEELAQMSEDIGLPIIGIERVATKEEVVADLNGAQFIIDDPEPDTEAQIEARVVNDAAAAEIEEALAAMDTTRAELTEAEANAAQNLKAKTLIFEMCVRGMSFTRKVSPSSLSKPAKGKQAIQPEQASLAPEAEGNGNTETARAAIIRASKQLLQGVEIENLNAVTREFKKWLSFRQLDCSILRGGMYLVPIAYVQAIDERFRLFKENRKLAVRALLENYDRLKTEARARFFAAELGELWNEADYPSKGDLARAFSVSGRWLAFDAPTALQSVKSEIWREAERTLQIQLAEAVGETRDALRGSFAEYVDWLIVCLTPGQDGKKRNVTESKIAQFREFLSTVDTLNLTGDADLTKLVSQARDVLEGLDLKSIRKDEGIRSMLQTSFTQLQETTGAWIVTKERQILFDESAV